MGCLLGSLVCTDFYFGAGQIVQGRAFAFSLEGKDLTRSLVGEEDWGVGGGEGSSIFSIQSVWFPCPQLYLLSSSLETLFYPLQPINLQMFSWGTCLIA